MSVADNEALKPDSDGSRGADGPSAANLDASGAGGADARPVAGLAVFAAWATRNVAPRSGQRPRWWPTPDQSRRRARTMAMVAGPITLVLIWALTVGALLASRPGEAGTPWEAGPSASGRGDPALANRLAKEAEGLARRDPLATLRLLLAAHTVDPDSAAHRMALAQLLLGPRPLTGLASTVGSVTSLAFAADGAHLAVGGRGVQILNVANPAAPQAQQPIGDETAVTAVRFSSDGQQLVVADDRGVRTYPVGVSTLAEGETGGVPALRDLVSLGEQRWVATTRTGKLIVWTSSAGAATPSILADRVGTSAPVAATRDGRLVFAPAPGGVGIFAMAGTSGQRVAVLDQVGTIGTLAVSGDGRMLLVGADTTATLWDISQISAPRRLGTLAPPTGSFAATALAPEGRTAVTAGSGSTVVWDLSDPGHPAVLARLPIDLQAVAYSPDGTVLATGGAGSVQLWRMGELRAYQPGRVSLTPMIQTRLDAGEPITYATISADPAFLVTSGATQTQIWQTRRTDGEPRVTLAKRLDTPVTAASGAGTGGLLRSTLLLADSGGVSAWVAVDPNIARRTRQLTTHADSIAVAPDGHTAITVEATTATVWEVQSVGITATATLSYHQPTTALAFAPSTTTLIGGHADGSITVHHIGLPSNPTTKRVLTSNGGPVDAVALSADASTAVAVHQGGGLTVWNLNAATSEPAATIPAAAGAGPHRAWLSPTGSFAVISTANSPAVLWSLTDTQHPYPLLVLPLAAPTAVATMVSADGHTAVTIDPANNLAMWSLAPIHAIIDEPTARACQLADLNQDQWRRLVTNTAFNNPCQPAPLPKLDPSDPTPT